MKKTVFRPVAGVALALAITPSAQAIEVGGDIGVVSQYLWRGVPQSNSSPALQGDLYLDTGTGLSASLWFSNTGYAGAPQFGTRKVVEFDWTLDYSGAWNGIQYSIGSAYYTYLYDGNSNFSELYGSLSLERSIRPSLTIYYMQAAPKGSIAYMKGDMWFDLALSTQWGAFASSLTLSYAMYKNDALRPADSYRNGLSTVSLSLSRDVSLDGLTISPSLLLSLPLAGRDANGVRNIYGSPVKTEFVAGLNISY